MVKSLVGSISNLFNTRIQKSLASSQVEEASGEDMNEVHVEHCHNPIFTPRDFIECWHAKRDSPNQAGLIR